MKKVSSMIKGLVVLGITLSFIGVNSVSATRAITDRGTGCYVRTTEAGEYAYDATCSAHDVIKFDNKGNFQFYEYQDHGELPEGTWRPSKTYRNSFELCYAFSFGVVCGIATETISPSGEYKSSFKSRAD